MKSNGALPEILQHAGGNGGASPAAILNTRHLPSQRIAVAHEGFGFLIASMQPGRRSGAYRQNVTVWHVRNRNLIEGLVLSKVMS